LKARLTRQANPRKRRRLPFVGSLQVFHSEHEKKRGNFLDKKDVICFFAALTWSSFFDVSIFFLCSSLLPSLPLDYNHVVKKVKNFCLEILICHGHKKD
jgi:hypothetical protein